jgi:RNA polymerase sigma factor (sigma-70 family)
MRDAEVVASVVAGDSAGLAEAYDRYAGPLYAYCWFMLDDSADAVDAVQDTFLIAASRLGRLRDPECLRPWLYAVARNECLRRLRARQAASAPEAVDVTDVTNVTVDITEDAERAGLRMLVRSAVGGLNPSEREAIELQFGQGLEPAEVALVLGVSRNRARSLLWRARDQLQACLGVLLVGRAGRGDCDELNAMLSGWDGRLTVRLRKRVHRHVEQCATCANRRSAELRRAALPGMTLAAALVAMMAENTRLASDAPAGLRDHVLWMATTRDDDALAHQADLRSRARAFGRRGFPKPLPTPKSGWHHSPQGQAAMVAGVAAAVTAFVITLALTGNWLPAPAADPHSASHPSAQLRPPATAAAAAPQRTPAPHTSASTKAAKAPALAATHAPAHPTAKHPATASPSATPSVRHPTTAPPPSSTSTPAPSSPPPSATPTPTQAPTPGTLVVSSGMLYLTPFQPSGTITLTAENGPVAWSISQTDGPTGVLVISPAAGLLAEGQSVQVTVTAESAMRFSADLMVNPGGQTVTVVYHVGHGSY